MDGIVVMIMRGFECEMDFRVDWFRESLWLELEKGCIGFVIG